MISDYFKLAFDSIRHKGLRSWLTMVGIFIGIAAVVALISLGEGLQRAVDAQFELVGTNRLTLQPGARSFGSPGAQAQLSTAQITEDDVDTIRSVQGVNYAVGVVMKETNVKFKDQTKSANIFGIDTDRESLDYLEKVDFFVVEEGRMLKGSDQNKVVVGYNFKHEEFFDEPVEVGDKLEIEGVLFEVVGIFKKAGNPYHDAKITMQKERLRQLFDLPESLALVTADVKKGFDIDKVKQQVEKKIRRNHGVKEGEEDFQISTAKELQENVGQVIGVIQAFLVGIAGISLIVGSVGIMNTMYTSVLERTREIGVMKSIGAKNKDILTIFLIEAGLLGVVGGAIGVSIGVALSKTVEYIAVLNNIDYLTAYTGLDLLGGSLLFAFSVGAIAGVLPAKRAANMKPVDALRA